MGYQLAKRGKVYRDRCKFRTKPRNPGDNVFAPASFPPAEVEEEDTAIIPELPKEDLEEVRIWPLWRLEWHLNRWNRYIHS